MSAALQLPAVWAASPVRAPVPSRPGWRSCAETQSAAGAKSPVISLGFYRRHTDRLLRRYLYASMQVGRAPSILGDPVGRGWASSRPVRTFEDALVFVLDVERCLSRLNLLEREILSRIVLQAYTQEETAVLMGMSLRTVSYRLNRALDRLTEQLLENGLLILPE